MKIIWNRELRRMAMAASAVFLFSCFFVNFCVGRYAASVRTEYNEMLAVLFGNVMQAYPDIKEEEVIAVLNEPGNRNYGADILARYGVYEDYGASSFAAQERHFLFMTIWANGILILVCLTVGAFILLYLRKRQQEIAHLTDYMIALNRDGYELEMDNNADDELSGLRNEIYKLTVLLKEQAKEAVSQKQVLADTMVNISHQLKTPLTSATVLADNLSDNPDMDRKTRQHFLSEITRQITGMSWLITVMLKMARLDAEVVELENTKLGVKELVDEVIELDARNRAAKTEADQLRAMRNKLSKQIGQLMGQGKKEEALEVKTQVAANASRLAELEGQETELEEKIKKIMMTIPNIIDPSVPIGKDDSENVELERFGEPVVPDFEIPYHTDIMKRFDGIDLDAAGRVAGNGFYYLMGNIARLHSAVISYARDFMIDRGFTYCVPPFMIRSNVVTGVMSFAEMDAMMYKIEGEDLYLIGTSEHSMIGKFIDTITPQDQLPKTMTSYSPCFRKEKGAHGIEERGVYRIHQFEKQEMIVVCRPEESPMWYEKLWQNTVDLFRSLDIPVRTLECCSGDLADLKVKSCDVEAWSPRQKKYFEVGSCSNLGDAQARRLKIRVEGEEGKYFAHTLNNTVVAPPRMLIAFLENNLQEDGSVRIPEALQPYMGGMKVMSPVNHSE